MALSIEYRKKIKEVVPHGFLIEVAKEVGVTTQAVSAYLSGKSSSFRVEKALVERLNAVLKDEQHLKKIVDELFKII